jgi:hypothetical protein
MYILPLVSTFATPYEAWSSRIATHEEIISEHKRLGYFTTSINDQLIAKVNTPFEAAKYIAFVGADNGLGTHINSALDSCPNYASWKKAMPPATPYALKKYQKEYPFYDSNAVSREINTVNAKLSVGQTLFHAGLWPRDTNVLITDRPLSTSFCPQVALRNAEHGAKAYDANRIDLFVLNVTEPCTNVYAFKRKGTNMGHENEVLFAAGASLSLKSKTCINDQYLACKYDMPNKKISVYVLEIDIC